MQCFSIPGEGGDVLAMVASVMLDNTSCVKKACCPVINVLVSARFRAGPHDSRCAGGRGVSWCLSRPSSGFRRRKDSALTRRLDPP